MDNTPVFRNISNGKAAWIFSVRFKPNLCAKTFACTVWLLSHVICILLPSWLLNCQLSIVTWMFDLKQTVKNIPLKERRFSEWGRLNVKGRLGRREIVSGEWWRVFGLLDQPETVGHQLRSSGWGSSRTVLSRWSPGVEKDLWERQKSCRILALQTVKPKWGGTGFGRDYLKTW